MNAKKTDLVLFHSKNKTVTSRLTIKIKGTKFFLFNFVKYLGILIDSKLNWKIHISELTKKLHRATAILSKVRHYVSKPTLKSLYFSLFQSHLNYGCLVWGFAQKSLVNKILRIQKRAIRLITFSDYKCNTSRLFRELSILKINDHILLCRYEFVHDWIHSRLPKTFDNIFVKKPPTIYNIRRNHSKVTVPTRRLETWGTNSLRYQGSLLHNSLVDLGLHNIQSKRIVKNKIKSMLLSYYVWKVNVFLACLQGSLLFSKLEQCFSFC